MIEKPSVYILSRKKDLERREFINCQSDIIGLDYQFFDAIEPSDLDETLIKKKRNITIGEVCCAYSHLEIAKKIIKNNEDFAIILEDDALLHESLSPKLEMLKSIHNDFDVLILGYSKSDEKLYKKMQFFRPVLKRKNKKGFYYGIPYKQWTCGTVGYSLSKSGAEKLLRINSEVRLKADDWPEFERLGLKIVHCWPNFISEEFHKFKSSLEDDRKTYINRSLYKRYIAGLVRRIYLLRKLF